MIRELLEEATAPPLPPPIVCLCGSTRFKQAWIAENARLTGEGYIVLAVGLWGHHERKFPDEETKRRLDELHLRKIDLCELVWVLDVGGYIGESTRNEITYAKAHGKEIRYLSKEFPNYVEPEDPIKEVEKERDRWYGAAQERQIEINRLRNLAPELATVVGCAEAAMNHYDNDAILYPTFESLMRNLRAALAALREKMKEGK